MRAKIQNKEEEFQVLACEHDYMIHPDVFYTSNIEKTSTELMFEYTITLDQYQAILTQMWIQTDLELPVMNGVCPSRTAMEENEGVLYSNLNIPLKYTGIVLVAKDYIKEYFDTDEFTPFCYKTVYEYVFDQGVVITAIDHSKAMQRIRKNIDLGYRTLEKRRDRRCIERFMKTLFLGDYKKNNSTKKREKYLKDMKSNYRTEQFIQISESNEK